MINWLIKWVKSRRSGRMQQLGARIARALGRYGSRASYILGVLPEEKKFKNMDKESVKDIIWGGMTELMNNPNYFRRSSIDPKYSEWHPRGQEALHEFIEYLTPMIDQVIHNEIKSKAKNMTMSALKGNEV